MQFSHLIFIRICQIKVADKLNRVNVNIVLAYVNGTVYVSYQSNEFPKDAVLLYLDNLRISKC